MFLLFNPPGRDFKSDLILTVMNFIVFYLHFLIFKHFFTQSEESHHGASNSGDFYPTSGHLCYNSVFFKEFYLHKIKNILNLLTDDKLSILISHTSQTLSEHAVSTKVGNTAFYFQWFLFWPVKKVNFLCFKE